MEHYTIHVPDKDKMSSLFRKPWDAEPLRELRGQRLGRLNYSPSCVDIQSPWDMAH